MPPEQRLHLLRERRWIIRDHVLIFRIDLARGHAQHELLGVALANFLAELQRRFRIGGGAYDDEVIGPAPAPAACFFDFQCGEYRIAALFEGRHPFFAPGRLAVNDEYAFGWPILSCTCRLLWGIGSGRIRLRNRCSCICQRRFRIHARFPQWVTRGTRREARRALQVASSQQGSSRNRETREGGGGALVQYALLRYADIVARAVFTMYIISSAWRMMSCTLRA